MTLAAEKLGIRTNMERGDTGNPTVQYFTLQYTNKNKTYMEYAKHMWT